MTDMTTALRKAGLHVSLNKRVWTWLKDHPNKTAKEISAGLNVPKESVSPTLTDLSRRGMVIYKKEYLSYLANTPGANYVNVYQAVGDEYELLPKPKHKKHVKKPIPLTPVKVALPLPPAVEKKSINIDELSLKEARELYDKLKEIFG